MKEESLAQPVFCMVKTRSRPNVSHAYAISLMFVQFFIVPGNLHHPAHCFHPSHRQTIYGWVTHTNSQKEKEEDNEKGKSKQYVGGSNLSIQKDRYIGQCPKENIWLREMVPYKLIQKMTLNVPNVQKKTYTFVTSFSPGDPIDCIVGDAVPSDVMDTYCWIHSTFT